MATVGRLLIDIAANTADLKTGLDAARRDLAGFQGSVQSGVASVVNLAKGVAGFTIAGVGMQQALSAITRATMEAEQQQARLTSVMRATGNAAGLTRQEYEELAEAVSQRSLFDDEAVLGGIAVLGTFRNVQGETFREGIQLAADMATVMGGDLQGAIVQVGKALNDPVAGVTALQRAGVTFSATQREQIKQFVETNQLAAAQRVVLTELASQFGGAGGEAAGTGLTGRVHQFTLAWGNMLERLGEGQGPLGRAASWFVELATAATRGLEALATPTSPLAELDAQIADVTARMLEEREKLRDYQQNDRFFRIEERGIAQSRSLLAQYRKEWEDLLAQRERMTEWDRRMSVWSRAGQHTPGADPVETESQREARQGLEAFRRGVDSQIEALTKQRGELAFGTEAWQLYAAAVGGATTAQLRQLEAAQEQFRTARDLARLQADLATRTPNLTLSRSDVLPSAVGTAGPVNEQAIAAGIAARQAQRQLDAENRAIAEQQERLAEFVTASWKRAGENIQDALGDAFDNLLEGQVRSLRDFAQQMLDIVRQTIAQILAAQVVAGITRLVTSAATSAIPGAPSVPSGPSPGDLALPGLGLQAAPAGAVAVPVTFNINAIDGASVREMLQREAPAIQDLVARAAEQSVHFRARLRGVRG